VRIAASGGGCCWTDAAVGTADIGQRCGLRTAAMAWPESIDSCCDGGGVFSWDARERCIRSRWFSRVSASFAVPAALLRWRFLRSAALSRFSGVDFLRLRVSFVAGCVPIVVIVHIQLTTMGSGRVVECGIVADIASWRESDTP
jgi:hypothetical protein